MERIRGSFLYGKRFVPVRVKILLSLVLISALLITVVVLLSYKLTTDRVERIGMRLSRQYVISAGEEVKDRLDGVYDKADEIVSLEALHEMARLSLEDLGNLESCARLDTEIKMGVESAAPLQAHNSPEFGYVAIYMKNGYSMEMLNNQSFPFSGYEDCLLYFINRGADFSVTGYDTPLWQVCGIRGNNEHIAVYLRFIYEPITLEKTGVIVFGIRNSLLKEEYSSYAPKGYILSADGTVMATAISTNVGTSNYDTQELASRLSLTPDSSGSLSYIGENGEEKTVIYYRITSMRAFLIVPFALDETEWETELRSYFLAVVIISVVLLAVAIFIALVLSRGLTTSISSLDRFISMVEEGNDSLRYKKTSNDEIGRLGEKLNSMLDELDRLNRSRQEEIRLNQRMELQLIQQQINPHLLYNTLDSVLWGIEQRNYDSAAEVLEAMSEFFKLSLSRGQMEIPLANEIKMIENYMTIQNKARQKNFKLVYDIPDSLKDYMIVKLTVQPLVENSVVHGFAGYRDDGVVQVAAKQIEDRVVITVEDNGIGMEPDEIKRVMSVLPLSVCPKEHRHFGLYNIHRRIVQRYGDQYGLTIESEVSEYTRISISLPLRDRDVTR